MKKASVLVFEIIAAVIALGGSAVSIISYFIDLPKWLSIICAALWLLSAILWLIMYLIHSKQQKQALAKAVLDAAAGAAAEDTEAPAEIPEEAPVEIPEVSETPAE